MTKGQCRKWFLVVLLLSLTTGPSSSRAEQASWTLGLSTGWTVKDKENRTYHEAKAVYGPVWVWRSANGVVLDTKIDSGVGFINDRKHDAWFAGVGPSWALYLADHPWVQLNFGSKATGISESMFDQDGNRSDLDIGGNFQFHSHLGFGFRLGSDLVLSARGEHISNAGIEDPNPGLDFATIGLSYRF